MGDSAAEVTAARARLMPGELDALHRGVGSLSHYELLGVPSTAEPAELRGAHALLRTRLMSEPLGQGVSASVRTQIGSVVVAIDEAIEVLLDPARRALYDKFIASRRASQGKGFLAVTPRAPSAPSLLVPPVTLPSGSKSPADSIVNGGLRDHLEFDDPWPLLADTAPRVEVLPALARQSSMTPAVEGRVPSRPAHDPPRATKTTGAMLSQSGDRHRWSLVLEVPAPPEVMFESTRREFDALASAVELCLQDLIERRSPRAEAMRGATSTLAMIRGSHGAYAARIEEQMGRWREAADCWHRALDAQPANAHYALCAANAYLRAGSELDRAEHFALLAQELGGAIDAAGAVLSEVAALRSR